MVQTPAQRRRRRGFGSVRQLPSKRYQASYSDPHGNRVVAPTTFLAKLDAEGWLATEQAAMIEGRWKPPPLPVKVSPKFADYAAAWLERRELAPRTRTEYGRLLVRINETFGRKTLASITPDDVQQWYDTLDPRLATKRKHIYSLLQTVLNTAVNKGEIAVNPCRVEGVGKVKRVHEVKIATTAEIAAMVEALPDRYRMMLLLAHGCGLRFGELTELRRKDVDLDDGTIYVRRGVTWVEGQPIVGAPKSGAGIRRLFVPPHLLEDLGRHIDGHAQLGRDGLLFPSVSGDNHLNHGTWRKAFETARQAAGRGDLHFHDVRHTSMVNLAIAGATTRELMYVAGHTTPTMAMRYQHIADERLPELAKRVSTLTTRASKSARKPKCVGDG